MTPEEYIKHRKTTQETIKRCKEFLEVLDKEYILTNCKFKIGDKVTRHDYIYKVDDDLKHTGEKLEKKEKAFVSDIKINITGDSVIVWYYLNKPLKSGEMSTRFMSLVHENELSLGWD